MVRALGMLGSDREWRAELRRGVYSPVARLAGNLSRTAMRSSGVAQLAAAASGVRSAATASAARLNVQRGRSAAAVYGTAGPTGWLANAQHAGTTARNNPRWVGSSWRVGVHGEGPRGVNDAIADGETQIVDQFQRGALALIDRALK